MKYYQVIIDFRRDYLKLGYERSEMQVGDLERWTYAWCKKNNIQEEDYRCFRDLAFAYAEIALSERVIYRSLKRIRYTPPKKR